MNIKVFEIRDSATYIPVIAIKMEGSDKKEHYHLRRSGFSNKVPLITILRLNDMKAYYAPYQWESYLARTMGKAHEYIEKHFDDLDTGTVVDVEFINGETDKPKKSEMEFDGDD